MLRGKNNVAKRPEVREKLRRNHWSKNPKYQYLKEENSKRHKGNSYTKGKTMSTRGKTYEEIYGVEKAKELRKKRSIFFTGRVFSEKTKKNMSLAKKDKYIGKNNPAWIDGRSYDEYPIEFRKIRRSKIIHKRDNYTCQLCGDKLVNTKRGERKHLTLHHIDYNKKNNSINNLIALCNFCNTSVNKNRNEWTKLFQEKLNG